MVTYSATIYLAGDIESVKRCIRKRCYRQGCCVTVTATSFIYTGGEEAGVAIGVVNYPRFPSTPEAIFADATDMARELVVECCQKTALVVATDKTEWIVIDPPGAKQDKPEHR